VNYRLSIDLEAVHFARSLKRNDADRLVRWLDRLKDSPFTTGVMTVRDKTDREIQVSRVDRFLIYHWTDHAVQTVRVNAIEEVE